MYMYMWEEILLDYKQYVLQWIQHWYFVTIPFRMLDCKLLPKAPDHFSCKSTTIISPLSQKLNFPFHLVQGGICHIHVKILQDGTSSVLIVHSTPKFPQLSFSSSQIAWIFPCPMDPQILSLQAYYPYDYYSAVDMPLVTRHTLSMC